MRTRRAEWAERVERWRRSGLTANRFAASIGVNPGTLSHWAWRLGREQQSRGGLGALLAAARPEFVEVVSASISDSRFELQLGNGRRLQIPASFEAAALERLLGVLEANR